MNKVKQGFMNLRMWGGVALLSIGLLPIFSYAQAVRFTLDSEWVASVAKLGVQTTGADGGGACGALLNKLGSKDFYFASSPSSGSCYIQGKWNPPGFPGGTYGISCIYPSGTPPSSVTGTVQSKLTGLAPCEFSCPVGYKRYETTIYCQLIPCPVTPLIRPTDPDAIPFVDRVSRVREDRLTPEMSEVLANLRAAAAKSNQTISVTSAWRPTSYQNYLRDITVKRMALLNVSKQITACDATRRNVNDEFLRHGLNGIVANGVSAHEIGNAFDFVPVDSNFNAAEILATNLVAPRGRTLRVIRERRSNGSDSTIHIEFVN